MKLSKMMFKIDDNVIVKQGVKEPDLGKFELGGWQGRVTAFDSGLDAENALVTIEWDSLTLKQIPAWFIEDSETEGFDWETMVLSASDIEKTISRDKKGEVKKAQKKLENKHHWTYIGEEGKRIAEILRGINLNDEMKCLYRWSEYLDEKLSFPIKAQVVESQDYGTVKFGDTVSIKSLPHLVDMYGIIAKIKTGTMRYDFPLCDLEVIDKTSTNYRLIDDYRVWFANR